MTAFNRYDADHSGQLSINEITNVLKDMSMLPQTREEQEEIGKILQDCDEDGSGDITFEEFQVLSQRFAERRRAMRLADEKRVCCELGISNSQHKEIRHVFDSLDRDQSNTMSISEVRTALTLLRLDVSGDQLRDAFFALGQDG